LHIAFMPKRSNLHYSNYQKKIFLTKMAFFPNQHKFDHQKSNLA